MGKRAVCLVVGLAACGSSSGKPADAPVQIDAKPDAMADAKVFNDAPPDAPPMFDLSCIGNPAPTTANANVTVSGTAHEIGFGTGGPTFTALANATVDACIADCAGTNKLKTTTTDSTGAFSVGPLATSGTPLNAFVKLTPGTASAADPVVLEYPGEPLVADFAGIPLFTTTPTVLALLKNAGCSNTTTDGILAVLVTDCTNKPINDPTNITLVVQQGGQDVSGTTTINAGQFSSMAAGTFLVCNVPPNAATTVGAKYKTNTFLAHPVNVVAAQITAAQVRPGY